MSLEVLLLVVAVAISALGCVFALLAFLKSGQRSDDRSGEILLALSGLARDRETLQRTLSADASLARGEAADAGAKLRAEIQLSLARATEQLLAQTADLARQQAEQLNAFAGQLRQSAADSSVHMRQHQEALLQSVREFRDQTAQTLQQARAEAATSSVALSERIGKSLETFAETTRANATQLFEIQRTQHAGFETRLATLSEQHGKAGETLRQNLEQQLTALRQENGAKLEQMRATVDEKLQGTLEARLGESFKVVSDRLEAVHKGLGEMQTLASGVGDLKRVLTNVKARGSWGEVQLGALLEQVLTPNQYVTNAVMADNSAERVEFAIRMPGGADGREVFLPIDAKFPMEDYERLQAAAEHGDVEAVELAARALEIRLRNSARDISGKYVCPPNTTDFAIMFLPTEGLYAEAIRRPGLADELQRVHRVMIAGPTTLSAMLNSLQMGFRTLAIQQRSSEVWQVLGAVKTEFGSFGDVLTKVKKKLQEASNHMDSVDVRTRAIGRKLRQVEELPTAEATRLLGSMELDDTEESDEPAPTSSLFLHSTAAE